MEKNKYFQKLIVEDIGEIYLRYSQRIKNIKISINIIGDVLVVAPFFKNKSKVIKFLISNSNWIKINKKKSRNKDIKIISFDFNNNLLDDFKLEICKKVEKACDLHNFRYNKIYFKNMISRWGSCSSKNNISFNTLMYHLNDDLQDYIIKHELLHTKIKNHSHKFWIELEKICVQSKYKNKLINSSYFIKYY